MSYFFSTGSTPSVAPPGGVRVTPPQGPPTIPKAVVDDGKSLDEAGRVQVAVKSAPPALVRAAGRKTRSMKRALGVAERVWSLAVPLSWKLPASDNKVYRINDRYPVTTITTSTSNAVFTAAQFQVSGMGNVSACQSLFDQYRIVRVEVLIVPQANFVAAGSTATAGMMHSVIDYDDATPLASEQNALDYQNCLSSSASDGHFRSFVPHAALAAYAGAFTSYNNVESPWIDAAYPGVQHYGLKVVNTTASVATELLVYATLFTEWRNVR